MWSRSVCVSRMAFTFACRVRAAEITSSGSRLESMTTASWVSSSSTRYELVPKRRSAVTSTRSPNLERLAHDQVPPRLPVRLEARGQVHAQRAAVVRLRRLQVFDRIRLGHLHAPRPQPLERSLQQLRCNTVAAIRRRDDEARERADALLLGGVETEAVHDPVEPRGLAVVAPADRPAVDESEQRGDLSVLDELRHIAAVLGGRAYRPLLIGLRAVGLHAEARLPAWVVAKRVVVEELVVVGHALRTDILDG